MRVIFNASMCMYEVAFNFVLNFIIAEESVIKHVENTFICLSDEKNIAFILAIHECF